MATPAPAMCAWRVALAALCGAVAAHASGPPRCGDANGLYCGHGETCCYARPLNPADEDGLVFPEHLPTLAACCGSGSVCVQSCTPVASPAAAGFQCAPAGTYAAPDACGKTCCGSECCDACCGTQCLPSGATCCPVALPAPPFIGVVPRQPTSKAAAERRICPAERPTCCPADLCCPEGSDCCTGCRAKGPTFECCGGCTCCDTDAYYCSAKDAQCLPISYLWLRQLLMLVWASTGAAVVAYAAKLAMGPSGQTPALNYIEIDQDGGLYCPACGHVAHHGRVCNDGRINRSEDCVNCRDGCRRRGCHRGSGTDRACSKAFTVDEKTSTSLSNAQLAGLSLTPLTRSSQPQYETVSIQVVNATCECTGCACRACQPILKCPCRKCECKNCRSIFSIIPKSSYAFAAAGVVLLGTSLTVQYFLDDALSRQLSMAAVAYVALDAIVVIAYVVYVKSGAGAVQASMGRVHNS